MFDHLSDQECARAAAIKSAAQGFSSYELAQACSRFCPGFDFRGMGKKAIYDEFARGELSHIDGVTMRAGLASYAAMRRAYRAAKAVKAT